MTDTALEPVAPAPVVPSKWGEAWRLAQRISDTPFVPSAFKRKPESVLACILYGDELGLGPMQSLASIHVIEGKPSASPELMRALIARAGHRVDVTEATDQQVTMRGRRSDTGAEATVTWSIADAERAGLAGRGSWSKYPRAMLLARATSELARMIFPDVTMGLSYTPEEMVGVAGGEWDETPLVDPLNGQVIDTTVADQAAQADTPDESDIIDAEVVDNPQPVVEAEPLPPAEPNAAEQLFRRIVTSPDNVRTALAEWRGNRPTTVREMTKDGKWLKAVGLELDRLTAELDPA